MKVITLTVPEDKLDVLERFAMEHDLSLSTEVSDIPLWQQVEVNKRMREALRNPEALVPWEKAWAALDR